MPSSSGQKCPATLENIDDIRVSSAIIQIIKINLADHENIKKSDDKEFVKRYEDAAQRNAKEAKPDLGKNK